MATRQAPETEKAPAKQAPEAPTSTPPTSAPTMPVPAPPPPVAEKQLEAGYSTTPRPMPKPEATRREDTAEKAADLRTDVAELERKIRYTRRDLEICKETVRRGSWSKNVIAQAEADKRRDEAVLAKLESRLSEKTAELQKVSQ